jgi:hypothetical protein
MAKKACGKYLASKPKKSRKRKAVSSSSESDQEEPVIIDANSNWLDEDEDAECIYCTGLLSQDMAGEKWVVCVKCSRRLCGKHFGPLHL